MFFSVLFCLYIVVCGRTGSFLCCEGMHGKRSMYIIFNLKQNYSNNVVFLICLRHVCLTHFTCWWLVLLSQALLWTRYVTFDGSLSLPESVQIFDKRLHLCNDYFLS